MLRVRALNELFAAAETLGRIDTLPGRRLAIFANGRGTGMLAADRLLDMGGTLATLSDDTVARPCDAIASSAWPRHQSGRHQRRRRQRRVRGGRSRRCCPTPDNDAVLVLNVPTALIGADSRAAGAGRRPRPRHCRAIATASRCSRSGWARTTAPSPASMPRASRPTPTEADAVRGFMYLVRHREAQQTLMETPPSLPDDLVVDTATARDVVDAAVADGRRWLDPIEVTRVLGAYGIADHADAAGARRGRSRAGGRAAAGARARRSR